MDAELKERARGEIIKARGLVALTGAGISAESGVPTFRGREGLWRSYSPEELATPEAFARNPTLIWEWYQWRRSLIDKVSPNAGHRALAHLEEVAADFILITQNVDGLHQLAGSRNVLELHGNIWRSRCTGCGRIEEGRKVDIKIPPRCQECNQLLRPAVVWFGESLNTIFLDRAIQASRECDLMLVTGTSGVVQPAASLPFMAKEAGAVIIEVNPDLTPITPIADLSLRGGAAQILPEICG